MEKEFLTKAICLSSCDYKEKDKQVTLFSLENGLMTAVLKGCKSPKAKLKFAFSPFCFAEYNIVTKNNFNTITNASLIDSFFDLSQNYDNFCYANLMLDITHHIVKFGETNLFMFINLLNCLKAICYEQIDAKMVTIKFCLVALENMGYKLTFNHCFRCNMPFNQDKYLDLSSGELVCQNCKTLSSEQLTNNAFSSLKIISQTSIDRFNSIKLNSDVLLLLLKLLIENIECRLEHKILSKKLINF